MSDWIEYPPPPVIHSTAPPLLVDAARLEELVEFLRRAGADCVSIDVGGAADAADVIEALRLELPFPDWCGSSWDSIEDAFAELRDAWSFPLAVVLEGFGQMLDEHPHAALHTVIRFDALAAAFSAAGDQLIVAFEGPSWS
jgi:hypothetical protein